MVAIVRFTVTGLAARVSAMPGHDGYTIRKPVVAGLINEYHYAA
jgi:hypothetical protein